MQIETLVRIIESLDFDVETYCVLPIMGTLFKNKVIGMRVARVEKRSRKPMRYPEEIYLSQKSPSEAYKILSGYRRASFYF